MDGDRIAEPGTRPLGRVGYKRGFDLTILVIAHCLLLPLWLILWTAIPLIIWLGDRGPVFYKQKRVGRDGDVFTILKFRTMVPEADRMGPSWTTVGDPRVTRAGRILRRTALDELPEILSIWKGEMSLVGPEPWKWRNTGYWNSRSTGSRQGCGWYPDSPGWRRSSTGTMTPMTNSPTI